MILNPKIGEKVLIWYNARVGAKMPYHGKTGTVWATSPKGRPRNHLVVVEGKLVSIPCGNVQSLKGRFENGKNEN